MAAPMCSLRTVIHGCHRHVFKTSFIGLPSSFPNRSQVTVRFYAAESAVVKKFIKEKKASKEPVTKRLTKEQLAEKRKDIDRPKPFGLTAWKPSDDVYVARYYPKPTLEPETAIQMLKTFQELDFTYPAQAVYVELKLDMKLEKKKAEEAEIAKQNGAAFVGGIELIPQILNDEIEADFYIATPDIVAKLNILKNKLRKKFPKTKRGSVGNDVANMIKLFETSYEYMVDKECLVQTKIATLDMPVEQISANIDALVKDICKHKPLSFGPFVERALITSATSEALFINCQKFLPQEVEDNDEE
ncbi:large ribosomal subunit protein uL1m isoform X2 [Dendropsophus ebraccatus]|uniref:large ribosomal subunit protein uL1m isoform X2 n=1 Tax=Dendropsophus ebraccatus TaxID=150705 RepID=UPI003831319D